MEYFATNVHRILKDSLKNYILSQYFGKSPLIFDAVERALDGDEVIAQDPYIESSPSYKSVEDGLQKSHKLPQWLKDFFSDLIEYKLGVYKTPFYHQIQALESFIQEQDLFVATGTGSGKTECFMWPLVTKLVTEAKTAPKQWNEIRGIRTIILYPMNALVGDQLSRLRRLMMDKSDHFVTAFRKASFFNSRRPQFGMYTGRTPFPGDKPISGDDKRLADNLSNFVADEEHNKNSDFINDLAKQGRVPAKKNLLTFIESLKKSKHQTSDDDSELITRFEMQNNCPDILITNYSMLELILLRPIENKIWQDTKNWLQSDKNNKLLFVIDEAHMYRGSFGGEVALLIRRLMAKLDIDRDRIQFILTTASMPKNCDNEINEFADKLTSAKNKLRFKYLTGVREETIESAIFDIPVGKYKKFREKIFEKTDLLNLDSEKGIELVTDFFQGCFDKPLHFSNKSDIEIWLFYNLHKFSPFSRLFNECRGQAKSLRDLSINIFREGLLSDASEEDRRLALSVLLLIAPLAKNEHGITLFPARMHMLFRGIKGVYACTNPNCKHAVSNEKFSLGKIYLNEGRYHCIECDSNVYELYYDRRCGALYLKGFIDKNFISTCEFKDSFFLWTTTNRYSKDKLTEIHFYIPEKDFVQKSNYKFCYLDYKTGFIHLHKTDDNKNSLLKLMYYYPKNQNNNDIFTFHCCPHCNHNFSVSQLSSFKTIGNMAFNELIKQQFILQPPVESKKIEKFPNEGRKVLLFSDSRARAARLALDMSNSSNFTILRQLFALAVDKMQEEAKKKESKDHNYSLFNIYGFLCNEIAKKNVFVFNGDSRKKLIADSIEYKNQTVNRYSSGEIKSKTLNDAPKEMQEYLLRLFAGKYNTFYDTAIMWLAPTQSAKNEYFKRIYDEIQFSEDEESYFEDIFYAWIKSVLDEHAALDHTINDDVRHYVRRFYDNDKIGLLKNNWEFSKPIKNILNLKNNSKLEKTLKNALGVFLESNKENPNKLYINTSTVKPVLNREHVWYRCDKCSDINPFLLLKKCPNCESECVHILDKNDIKALKFWSTPINEVLDNKDKQLFSLNIEEHTAQLSYKDQRDDLLSKTEEYELRFQDIIHDNETPVDILSSTTTMEVGIDIGSLIAVGLRNVPPTRENYQQRAGRAGRRGASLSTILTFCEDAPHDNLYYKNPAPMFAGDPRTPWIDTESKKLIERHLNILVLQNFATNQKTSIHQLSVEDFFSEMYQNFSSFVNNYNFNDKNYLFPNKYVFDETEYKQHLLHDIEQLYNKYIKHPDLYASDNKFFSQTMLDALYEEGIIPTYSFPKNVVSTYITGSNNKLLYRIDRSLDVAIGEFAPGRALVVDKKLYQIGALYSPLRFGKNKKSSIIQDYFEDQNYKKRLSHCSKCGWFGVNYDKNFCPYCHNTIPESSINMLIPWGFAPKNGTEIYASELDEKFTSIIPPIYSTVPAQEEIKQIDALKNIKVSTRSNQRIIMLNKGYMGDGFSVCVNCGAASVGKEIDKNIKSPYSNLSSYKCRHNFENVYLGYDFITDMLVMEFVISNKDFSNNESCMTWLKRASQTVAEALRLAGSQLLDIDFTELNTGFRLREENGITCSDIYLYDQLSSGAGYSTNLSTRIKELIEKTKIILNSCNCDYACRNCLKHYRNQFVHGELDRTAALDLLLWGVEGKTPSPYSYSNQVNLIYQLENILKSHSIQIVLDKDKIYLQNQDYKKELVIYPTFSFMLEDKTKIMIKDFDIKFNKPKFLKDVTEALGVNS